MPHDGSRIRDLETQLTRAAGARDETAHAAVRSEIRAAGLGQLADELDRIAGRDADERSSGRRRPDLLVSPATERPRRTTTEGTRP